MRASNKILLSLATLAILLANLAARADDKDHEALWRLRLGEYIYSCPAIGADGTIYTTVTGWKNYADVAGGKLAAVTTNGVDKWVFTTKADIKSSPAIGADGTIYFGCRDRNLYAVRADGKLQWAFKTGAWVDSSPAIARDGTIYFGSWDGKFYALSADGKKKWELDTGAPIDSSASIGIDGTIYFGSHDKNFYALNPDGTVKWKITTGSAIISSAAIDDAGVIYFTSMDGKFYAINPDGSKKWIVWTGGVHPDSPVIDAEGNIYIGVNNLFCAYKPDGTRKWGWGYPTVNGSAALSADGSVYFAADSGNVYSFLPDETPRTYYYAGGAMSGSLTISNDGIIYAGSYTLDAFQAKLGLIRGGWPKFHGRLLQTGRKDE